MKKNVSKYNSVIKSYPIVFKDAYGDPAETCMAFGVECGEGWYEPINTMSARLEELNNIYYPRYGVRIQYDQIKEKFGELTVYWSVEIDPRGIRKWLSSPFKFVYNIIHRHVRFNYKHIEDRPGYHTEEWDEISKDVFDEKKHPDYVENHYGWKFKEENGKYYRNSCVFHSAKWHTELQNHKILHWIMGSCYHIYASISSFEPSFRQESVRDYLENRATTIVNEATNDAYEHCEHCGRQIGTRWNPRCQTTGWISYICEECAKKRPDRQYIKNHSLYINGECLKTPEEYKAMVRERYGKAWTEEDDKKFDED